MQWDLSPTTCSHGPFQRGFLFFIFIALIYVVAYLISNLVIFSFTKKGLGRIETSFKAGNDSDQPVRFKDFKFKKRARYSVINAILETFRDLERLKVEGNSIKLWELKIKDLKDQVENTFFKRNPFLVICVLSVCFGVAVFAKEIMLVFQLMSITGSGGIAALSGGVSEALIIPLFASITCLVSALAFLSAGKSAKKIVMEITKLEIRLIEMRGRK